MATISLSFRFPPLPKLSPPLHHRVDFSVLTWTRIATLRTCATGGDLLGDFGARDPFPAELESGFAEKVVFGWRLLDEEDGLKLQCLWKLRDFKCGVELINRIYKVTESSGHFPNLHLEQTNQVRAELWTSSIGGLSMNDFIVAAKIDEIKTSDLALEKEYGHNWNKSLILKNRKDLKGCMTILNPRVLHFMQSIRDHIMEEKY
ncbi:hypothetical protein GH714_025543 [Hevea brasiliensis]|uniref:4a-hydroxytetrahydrobiopterin dehydratase n=1 Tax=Hevea brasiliensis TaxID=3981 RepID=A0A6A6MHN0_HEVBR|nr:hypothetical protein GH714_025543 [Hevea brasiliensis]